MITNVSIFILSLAAVVLGMLGLGRIKKSQGVMKGKWIARIGIALGVIGLLINTWLVSMTDFQGWDYWIFR